MTKIGSYSKSMLQSLSISQKYLLQTKSFSKSSSLERRFSYSGINDCYVDNRTCSRVKEGRCPVHGHVTN